MGAFQLERSESVSNIRECLIDYLLLARRGGGDHKDDDVKYYYVRVPSVFTSHLNSNFPFQMIRVSCNNRLAWAISVSAICANTDSSVNDFGLA